jgi:hypothetical protein
VNEVRTIEEWRMSEEGEETIEQNDELNCGIFNFLLSYGLHVPNIHMCGVINRKK